MESSKQCKQTRDSSFLDLLKDLKCTLCIK